MDNEDLAQPDFSVDILEEPAAEPINIHGDGWIPMTIDQVIKNMSDDPDSTTKLPRIPKVCKNLKIDQVIKNKFDDPDSTLNCQEYQRFV